MGGRRSTSLVEDVSDHMWRVSGLHRSCRCVHSQALPMVLLGFARQTQAAARAHITCWSSFLLLVSWPAIRSSDSMGNVRCWFCGTHFDSITPLHGISITQGRCCPHIHRCWNSHLHGRLLEYDGPRQSCNPAQ